jgi:hypothetical protein
LLIAKADDSVTFGFQIQATTGIGFYLSKVNAAVDFNDQSRSGTVKIDNASANRVLATEFDAGQQAITQAFPQNLFCRCHALAQLSGALLDGSEGAHAFGSHWILGSYSLILHEIGWCGTPSRSLMGKKGLSGVLCRWDVRAFPQDSSCLDHHPAQLLATLLSGSGSAHAYCFHWILRLYALILHDFGWRGTPSRPLMGEKGLGVMRAFPQNLFCRCHALAQLFGALLDRSEGTHTFGSHWISRRYA